MDLKTQLVACCQKLWRVTQNNNLFSPYRVSLCVCVFFLELIRGCLVCDFKQPFSVFKQHFTYLNVLFHPHVFSKIFSNNNFQFLNTCTKRALTGLFCFVSFYETYTLFIKKKKKKKIAFEVEIKKWSNAYVI